jgi:hypothetical protein
MGKMMTINKHMILHCWHALSLLSPPECPGDIAILGLSGSEI